MDSNDGGAGGGASFDGVFGGGADTQAGSAGAGGADTVAGAAGADTMAGAGSGAADPDWYAQVSGDPGEGESASLRDWVKAAGVKDLNGLAKVARDNQRALRESGRIKVPGDGAAPEEVAAFHKAIGVPETVEGYAPPVPKGADGQPLLGADGKPIEMNSALIARLAGSAHKAGMPAAAWDAMVGEYVAAQMEEMAVQDGKQQEAAAAKMKEWGEAANVKMAAVNQALTALGVSRDEALALRQAWGAGRAMDVLAKLGSGIAEDVLLNGSGSKRFGVSGAEAQKQLDTMKADPQTAAKIRVPGSPENIRYKDLIRVIADEEDRKQQAA